MRQASGLRPLQAWRPYIPMRTYISVLRWFGQKPPGDTQRLRSADGNACETLKQKEPRQEWLSNFKAFSLRLFLIVAQHFCSCRLRSDSGGSGRAVEGRLRSSAGQRGERRIHQRGRWEQLVPANDCAREVQLLQEDLCNSHEAFVVHAAVVSPDYHLQEEQYFSHLLCMRTFEMTAQRSSLTCRTFPWGLSSNSSACWYRGSRVFRAILVFFLATYAPLFRR